MNRKTKKWFFLASVCGLAVVFVLGFLNLPPLGDYRGPYGDVVNAITVPERHITNAVTAVNFDIRGSDTLGEEFILFTSVMAVVLLLRRLRHEPSQEHADRAADRRQEEPTDAIRVVSIFVAAATVVFGIYVVVHGQLTPGGGFQGGVILASAPLLLYLASEFDQFKKAVPRWLAHFGEAVGAGAYVLIGLGAMAAGASFLENILPLGTKGSVFSGGTIALIDIAVGLEVSGGLALLLISYLEETFERKEE